MGDGGVYVYYMHRYVSRYKGDMILICTVNICGAYMVDRCTCIVCVCVCTVFVRVTENINSIRPHANTHNEMRKTK